jgi:hypothetical protein
MCGVKPVSQPHNAQVRLISYLVLNCSATTQYVVPFDDLKVLLPGSRSLVLTEALNASKYHDHNGVRR